MRRPEAGASPRSPGGCGRAGPAADRSEPRLDRRRRRRPRRTPSWCPPPTRPAPPRARASPATVRRPRRSWPTAARRNPECGVKPNSTASTPSWPACTISPDASVSGAESSGRARRGGHRDAEPRTRHRQAGELGGDLLGQRLGGLGPRLGDRRRGVDQLGGELVDPPLQAGERLLGHVELRQPVAGIATPRQHAVDVGRVLAGQAAQLRLGGPAFLPVCLRRWAIRRGSRRAPSTRHRSVPAPHPSRSASARRPTSSVAASADLRARPTPSAADVDLWSWVVQLAGQRQPGGLGGFA